ncbi:MAG: transposase, partial [Cytophagaceae bacterium]|nr:transposase [Gemmatimonadaceae bacterium]
QNAPRDSKRLLVATGPPRGFRHLRGRGPTADVDAFVMGRLCAQVEGYNLQAATRVGANDRQGLERISRYLARPPIATDRLSQLADGRLELRLKRPWRDGTTAFLFTPHELLERLVALVPRPRAHLTRYHGVLAPAFAARAQIVPRENEGEADVERVASPMMLNVRRSPGARGDFRGPP